jgi:aspartyl-tRNA(Asn)/glutamyl-tRNA(Gln) amidotransferase subunit C
MGAVASGAMALTDDQVRHVARLARIALTNDEIASLRDELSKILDYAEKVGEVATTDVAPTGHAYPLANVFRDDEPGPSLAPDEALATAPEAEDGRFRVPKIMDEEQ